MVRIKHIAIRTPDPEKTAAFYKDVFGLKEVGKARTGCYLSDGYINLAVLPAWQNGGREGIFHFGFQVEDVPETSHRAQAAGAAMAAEAQPQDGRYDEFRLHDPIGTPVDLSEHGWDT